jgi:large subunit ribosomal protein L10
MMERGEKDTVVDALADRVSKSPSLYLTDFTGLSVKGMTELRGKLREKGANYVVVKNKLAVRAFAQASIEGFEDVLVGPTGIVLTEDDPAVAAKILKEFQKEHQKPAVKAGLVDGRRLTVEEVDRLASLPGREELLGQLAGAMQAPLQEFVGITSGLLNQFVGVVEALRSQRSDAA